MASFQAQSLASDSYQSFQSMYESFQSTYGHVRDAQGWVFRDMPEWLPQIFLECWHRCVCHARTCAHIWMRVQTHRQVSQSSPQVEVQAVSWLWL